MKSTSLFIQHGSPIECNSLIQDVVLKITAVPDFLLSGQPDFHLSTCSSSCDLVGQVGWFKDAVDTDHLKSVKPKILAQTLLHVPLHVVLMATYQQRFHSGCVLSGPVLYKVFRVLQLVVMSDYHYSVLSKWDYITNNLNSGCSSETICHRLICTICGIQKEWNRTLHYIFFAQESRITEARFWKKEDLWFCSNDFDHLF